MTSGRSLSSARFSTSSFRFYDPLALTCFISALFARVIRALLLHLRQDRREVVALRILQRWVSHVGLELLQPHLLSDGQHVPVVHIRVAGGSQRSADGKHRLLHVAHGLL